MGVWAVWTDCLDLNLPKLCLFTLRSIKENEELTFDYTNFGGTQSDSDVAATPSIASTSKMNESLTNEENDENLNDVMKKEKANESYDEFDNSQIIQTIVVDSTSDEEDDEDEIMKSPKPKKTQNSLIDPQTSAQQDGFDCRCGAPKCRKIIFC